MSIRPFRPHGPQLGWLGQAHADLNGKRKTERTTRLLPGRATRLQVNGDDSISVFYHRTAVVTYECDGRVTLRSGGWATPTTRSKIAEYCPTVSAWTKDYTLYVAAHARETDALLDTAALVLDPKHVALDGEQQPLAFRSAEPIVLHPDGLLCYQSETREQAFARIDAWRRRPVPLPRRPRTASTQLSFTTMSLQP